jgi:hypothetical protein
MVISKELYVPAARTLREQPPAPTGLEAGWIPGRSGRYENRKVCAAIGNRNQNLRSRSNPSLVTGSNTGLFKIGSRGRIPQIRLNREVYVRERWRPHTHTHPPTHPFTHSKPNTTVVKPSPGIRVRVPQTVGHVQCDIAEGKELLSQTFGQSL